MATAFAALVSLQNNLHLIYNHPRHSFSFEKDQIGSLWAIVCFLIDFMKSFDGSYGVIKEAAAALDSRIARAAQAAEDIIESHVVDQICRGSTLGGGRFRFLVQKAFKNMDFKMANLVYQIDRGLTLGEDIESYFPEMKELMIQAKAVDEIPRGSSLSRDARSHFLLDLQKAIEDMDYIKRKAVNVHKLKNGFKAEQRAFSATTSLTYEKNPMVGFDVESLRP